jgi:hypothetical protein
METEFIFNTVSEAGVGEKGFEVAIPEKKGPLLVFDLSLLAQQHAAYQAKCHPRDKLELNGRRWRK